MTLDDDRRTQPRASFLSPEGAIYLDTATYGLAPTSTARVMAAAIRAWQLGEADWVEDWDQPTDQARVDFAALVGVGADEIACIPSTSVGVATVAAMLGHSDVVVVDRDEMTSTLFPILVAGQRGATIVETSFGDLAAAITPATTLIAFSLVQMQTGRVVDLAGICDAARRHGARILVDATQGLPFVPVDAYVGEIDYLVCSAYKHLLCPRGVAFLRVRPDRWDDLDPINANWRAADAPFGRFFGGPLTLAPDARRFDVSRAWFPWLGATESLRLLEVWRRDGALDDVLGLADALADALGVPWLGSTLVTSPIRDHADLSADLERHGIRASVRGERLRLSVHVYNDAADIARASAVIRPYVRRDA